MNEFSLRTTTFNGFLIIIIPLIFLLLKVAKVISWQWLWVLSPLWVFGGLVCLMWLLVSIKYMLT